MPSLDDITQLAKSFERLPLAVIPERCVRVRNRNASCNRCTEACGADALVIEGNDILFSPESCVNCGACASVCPTEAFAMLEPTRTAIVKRIEEVSVSQEEPVIILCARMAARKEVSLENCVEVPCLAYVDEALLVSAVSQHGFNVALVDACCSTCKYGWNDERINAIVLRSQELLKIVGSNVCIDRFHEVPPELIKQNDHETFGDDRRHFLSQAVEQMKQTALMSAQQTIENKLGRSHEESIYDNLRVGTGGTLPQFTMPRHMQLLDALDSFEPASSTVLDSSFFANMKINQDLCNLCGMCVTFCPTGAISVGSYLSESHTPKEFDYLACDCVNCGLCVDVCWKYALTLDHPISIAELFSFEPRKIDLGTRKPKLR